MSATHRRFLDTVCVHPVLTIDGQESQRWALNDW